LPEVYRTARAGSCHLGPRPDDLPVEMYARVRVECLIGYWDAGRGQPNQKTRI